MQSPEITSRTSKKIQTYFNATENNNTIIRLLPVLIFDFANRFNPSDFSIFFSALYYCITVELSERK